MKKFLSFVLTFAMVLSMIPMMAVPAFATGELSIWGKLNKAMSGEAQETVEGEFEVDDTTPGVRKIKLLDSIFAKNGDTALVVKSETKGGKKIILDLNNCFLVRGFAGYEDDIEESTGNVIKVLGGELEINDTSAGKMGMLFGGKACQGGGIYNEGGTVTIKQCVIMNCSAEYSSSDPEFSGNGGGIYNSGKLTIENCSIQYCSAYCGGGGIYNKYDNLSDLSIENSTISNCTATGKEESCGGAIYSNRNVITINKTKITDCAANRYGAGIFNTGKMTLTNSEISNCSNTFNDESCGGAIYNSGAYYPNEQHDGEIIVRATTIGGCKTSFRGAGIYNGGKTVLEDVEIKNCGTTMYNGEGGGVYNAPKSTTLPIEIYVGGKTVITSNAIDDGPIAPSKIPNNIYLSENTLITIGKGNNGVAVPNQMEVHFTKGYGNGIGVFATNGTENDTAFFSSDISTYTIDKDSNNKPIINGHYTIDYIKETITPDSGYELLNSSFELISLVDGKTSASAFTKYYIRKSDETVAPGFYTPYRSIQPLNAPTLNDATSSTIVINANEGEEYLCIETANIPNPFNIESYVDSWNSTISNNKVSFTGLKSSTSYTIYSRVKAITTEGSEKFASLLGNNTLVASTTAPTPTYYGPTYYSVSSSDSANGSFKVDKSSMYSGGTVTVTVTPDKGFVLETLTVLDKNGKSIEVKDLGNNKYSFTMPSGKVDISASFMEDNRILNYCVDVKANDYYYDSVLWAYENEICKGVDELHFNPAGIASRAEMLTFMWRAAGSPEPKTTTCNFTDVDSNSYYYKAVLWAVEKGITDGTSATTFSPTTTVDRAQTVTFLARFAGVKDSALGYNHDFTDVTANKYYSNAVAWAYKNKITEGTGENKFSPFDNCQRGQVVTFLYRNFVK